MDSLPLQLQRAAQNHCPDLDLPHDLGLVLFRKVFRLNGNEEHDWLKHETLSCPHCNGSGHKDDVTQI